MTVAGTAAADGWGRVAPLEASRPTADSTTRRLGHQATRLDHQASRWPDAPASRRLSATRLAAGASGHAALRRRSTAATSATRLVEWMTSRVDECGLWIQSEDGSAPPQPWHGKNKKGIEGSGRFAFAPNAYGLLCQKFLPVPPAHQQPAGCTPAASPTQAHTPVVVDPAPLLLHTPHAAALQEGHGVLHVQRVSNRPAFN